jgi:hypothetical protein
VPNYRIIIDINDVAEGDAEDVAQQLWDDHAEALDAKLGDFKVVIYKANGGLFDTGWEPKE